ncbi:hypothetical protein EDM21_19120 [Paenibacillus sp. N10]|uniref:Uncharacterized protein n=2 Tax=Paenibacillus lutrae TaxID=2078573 RepID=A0A7X3FLD2_9BACL|nr:hypothetical protein [Paenibacillus lutrae]MVP01609.1 hypothetical protein [Paenibacillus lutrae]
MGAVTIPDLQLLGDLIRFEDILAKRCSEAAERSSDPELRRVFSELAELRLARARQLLTALRGAEI